MLNWQLFFILIGISIPGILFIIPATKHIYGSIKENIPINKKIPSVTIFTAISIIQSFIFVIIASAIGTTLSHQVNLHAPVLEAIANNQSFWEALQPQLIPAIAIGIGGAVIFLIAYYLIVRPNLDITTVRCVEKLRSSAGLLGRIFYGGIVEEVLCRWGLMTLLVWLGALLIGHTNVIIFWMAIILSGLLFGLGHLPSYLAFGCKKTPMFIVSMLGLNLWAAIIFGWLFWHNGLGAAIIAHMLFHILWYPCDHYYKFAE